MTRPISKKGREAMALLQQAEDAIGVGDVERGWYLRGKADRLIAMPDFAAMRDDLYGAEYRAGFDGREQP